MTHRFLSHSLASSTVNQMRIEPALYLSAYTTVETAACPSCHRVLPRRKHQAIWIEVPIEDGWVAAYRLVIKKSHAVIAEARLFPTEKDPHRERHRPAGGWSERGALVPPTGMPGTILKKLRLQDPIAVLPQAIENWEAQHGRPVANRVLRRFRMSTKTDLARRTRGRRLRTDELVVGFAKGYAEKIDEGHANPIRDLASERSYSRDTVREIIREARERGFLTKPAEAGKAGGKLTPKARNWKAPGASKPESTSRRR